MEKYQGLFTDPYKSKTRSLLDLKHPFITHSPLALCSFQTKRPPEDTPFSLTTNQHYLNQQYKARSCTGIDGDSHDLSLRGACPGVVCVSDNAVNIPRPWRELLQSSDQSSYNADDEGYNIKLDDGIYQHNAHEEQKHRTHANISVMKFSKSESKLNETSVTLHDDSVPPRSRSISNLKHKCTWKTRAVQCDFSENIMEVERRDIDKQFKQTKARTIGYVHFRNNCNHAASTADSDVYQHSSLGKESDDETVVVNGIGVRSLLEEGRLIRGRNDRCIDGQVYENRSRIIHHISRPEETPWLISRPPKILIILILFGALLNPVLTPLVIYLLIRSKKMWSKGKYNSAYKTGFHAGGITLIGLLLTITSLVLFTVTRNTSVGSLPHTSLKATSASGDGLHNYVRNPLNSQTTRRHNIFKGDKRTIIPWQAFTKTRHSSHRFGIIPPRKTNNFLEDAIMPTKVTETTKSGHIRDIIGGDLLDQQIYPIFSNRTLRVYFNPENNKTIVVDIPEIPEEYQHSIP